MNIFSVLFDNNLFQRMDINRLDDRAQTIEHRIWQTSDKARDLGVELKELRRDLSRMALVVEALSRVAVAKGICSREEFLALLEDVDAEDGKVDGLKKDGTTVTECPACRHRLPAGAVKCQYCGVAL